MCGCSSKWKKAKISYSYKRCVKVQRNNIQFIEIKAFIILVFFVMPSVYPLCFQGVSSLDYYIARRQTLKRE